MGQHYWANLQGAQVNAHMNPEDFLPVFLLYNNGIYLNKSLRKKEMLRTIYFNLI